MLTRSRSPSRIHPWASLLACLLPLGCPSDDEVGIDDEAGPSLLPGDLVITEIMADPEGADDGLEWFEIHNASGAVIDLEGLDLVYSKVDGTSRKAHTIARSLSIAPGEYIVVGGVLDEIAAQSDSDHLDYGYAGDLGAFVGSGGYLAIESSGEIIDETLYVMVTSGVSRAFDGTLAPDAVANDDVTYWCDSRTQFDGPTFVATPGEPNDLCTQGDCMDNGVMRPVDPAEPGDFVITEVHANPMIVDDDVGEWFEIHALADFDLNGLEIGRDLADPFEQQILDGECIPVAAGDYVIFARELDMTLNGGIPADGLVVPVSIDELTVDGSLWISTASEGETPGMRIDEVTWSAKAGESTQLDPDYEDAVANDDLGNWCAPTVVYGAGDLGSPGGANEECAITPPEGQCVDPDTRELRDVEPVAAGGLVITEFLANPTGTDGPGEWFEVAVLADGDLNGLSIGKADAYSDTVEGELCLEVVADQYLVFAHETDPMLNGGLPQVDVVFDMSLNNSGSDLFIGYDLDPLLFDDRVTWDSTSEGISNSYGDELDTITNDDLALWCDGEPSSPGEANPMCAGIPPMGMCLDLDTNMMRAIVAPAPGDLQLTEVMPNPAGATDALGEWFEIHTTAAFDLNGLELGKGGMVVETITAMECVEVVADQWVALAIEGDPVMNCGVDPVTWVYGGPSLTNAPGDVFVGYGGMLLDQYSWTNAASGVAFSRDIMADEWCDAVDPYGCGDLGTPAAANPACGGGMMMGLCFDSGMNADRPIVVPQVGDLIISEFMANPNAVTDALGEWFELRALADVDLNGLELGNAQFMDGLAPDQTLSSADCLAVTPGETVLFARNADGAMNGGLPAVDFTFSFGVTNSNAFLYIGHGGALLDQVGWVASGTGASTSLDPDFYDPAMNDTADNADPAWCYETTVYGLGDKGTPDVGNGQCP